MHPKNDFTLISATCGIYVVIYTRHIISDAISPLTEEFIEEQIKNPISLLRWSLIRPLLIKIKDLNE